MIWNKLNEDIVLKKFINYCNECSINNLRTLIFLGDSLKMTYFGDILKTYFQILRKTNEKFNLQIKKYWEYLK